MPALAALVDELFDRPADEGVTLALLIQQRGEVVAERYGVQPENIFQPAIEITAESTLTSWSMAKSITHAAVGILVGDGALDVDAPAPVPEWAGTPKAAITTLQLLEMRSGLRFVEDYVDDEVSHCIEMLYGDSGPSHAAYAAALPLDHEPGTHYSYSSGTTNIIARIIGDVVSGGPGGDPQRPTRGDRDVPARAAVRADRHGLGDSRSSMRPATSSARRTCSPPHATSPAFGELYRHDGVTAARRADPADGLGRPGRTPVSHDDENGCDYGRHWWMWPQIPGSLACHGHEGQYIVVVPDRELVIVHLGKTDAAAAPQLRARLRQMIDSC